MSSSEGRGSLWGGWGTPFACGVPKPERDEGEGEGAAGRTGATEGSSLALALGGLAGALSEARATEGWAGSSGGNASLEAGGELVAVATRGTPAV